MDFFIRINFFNPVSGKVFVCLGGAGNKVNQEKLLGWILF